MGAGKTTIGKELSESLQVPVIDSDVFIEKREEKSINQIFQESGEATFRDLETAALMEICQQPPKIVTTGGGIIIRAENRDAMKKHGKVIFLYCDIEETTRRLSSDNSRPLFKADKEANKKRFEERLPLYKQADFTIDTTGKEVWEIVQEILKTMNEHDFTWKE